MLDKVKWCPKCQSSLGIVPNDSFCWSCGTALIIVPRDTCKCGYAPYISDRYCSRCGTKVVKLLQTGGVNAKNNLEK